MAIVETAVAVTTAVQGFSKILTALGIKGKTSHLSASQAEPNSWAFADSAYAEFKKHYSVEQCNLIAAQAIPLLIKAQSERWGFGTSYNQQLADSTSRAMSTYVNAPLWQVLHNLAQWISVNVDSANEVEFSDALHAFYQVVILGAVNKAGFDGAVMAYTIPDKSATPATTPPSPVATAGITNSAFSILFIGLIIGGLFLFMKGKK
jgi:hypothetical protein